MASFCPSVTARSRIKLAEKSARMVTPDPPVRAESYAPAEPSTGTEPSTEAAHVPAIEPPPAPTWADPVPVEISTPRDTLTGAPAFLTDPGATV